MTRTRRRSIIGLTDSLRRCGRYYGKNTVISLQQFYDWVEHDPEITIPPEMWDIVEDQINWHHSVREILTKRLVPTEFERVGKRGDGLYKWKG